MIFYFRCDIIQKSNKYAAMAQSVEHVIGNDEVISSILISSSRAVGFTHRFCFYSSERRSIALDCITGMPYSSIITDISEAYSGSPNSDNRSDKELFFLLSSSINR